MKPWLNERISYMVLVKECLDFDTHISLENRSTLIQNITNTFIVSVIVGNMFKPK